MLTWQDASFCSDKGTGPRSPHMGVGADWPGRSGTDRGARVWGLPHACPSLEQGSIRASVPCRHDCVKVHLNAHKEAGMGSSVLSLPAPTAPQPDRDFSSTCHAPATLPGPRDTEQAQRDPARVRPREGRPGDLGRWANVAATWGLVFAPGEGARGPRFASSSGMMARTATDQGRWPRWCSRVHCGA